MKLIIASSNAHKIKEIGNILDNHKIIAYTDIIPALDIIEDGHSFKENAYIKAQTVYRALTTIMNEPYRVLADDSGICIEALGGKPGIHSARYSEEKTDEQNLLKVISELEALGIQRSKAYFCAAMALVGDRIRYCTHGFIHGEVCITPQGKNGFGYDPIFIPYGKQESLSQMPNEEKNRISHRFHALRLMRILLQALP